MIKQAFEDLYPDKEFNYTYEINYSNRFNNFNANIKRINNHIELNLSSKWKEIGDEIKLGLIQHLLMRLLKDKKETFYTQLYSDFIKNLAKYTPTTLTDPILEESFNRVNQKYFNNILDRPNLKFGSDSKRQLGMYNYHDDTITISTIFENQPELLDFIMYHELLHKKEKFLSKNGKMRYHTSDFRKKEKQFENCEEIDKKIAQLTRKRSFFFS